jgi:hypothetical protein
MRNLIALFVGAVLSTGCGALLHGSRQNIDVQSSPSGAKVETSPASGTYTTPSTISLERKHSYVLTFTAPGYSPATFNIHNSIGTGTVIADVLLTGLVGVVVDGFTGSWYGLSPESANVTLTRMGGSEDGADAINVSIAMSTTHRLVTLSSSAAAVHVTVTKQNDRE